MDLIREFDPVSESGALVDLILGDAAPWSASHMYDRADDESRVDTGLRRSRFKTFTSPKALAAAAALVKAVSDADADYDFVLRRDDVTVLHYDTGGFFKPHADYVTLTSNAVEEFTLLMCLPTTECVGGATRFLLNPRFSAITDASVTPGRIVVFRKDIRHEATPVESGVKEVVTLNLYGVRRTDGPQAMIRCVDGPAFAAPVANLPKESVFSTLIADLCGGAPTGIIEIPIDDTGAVFEPVHRAIMRCQICVQDCDFDLMKKYGVDPSGLLTPGPDVPPSAYPTKSDVVHVGSHGRVTLYSTPELAEYFYDKHHTEDQVLFRAVICEGGGFHSSGSSGNSHGDFGPEMYFMTVTHGANIYIEREMPTSEMIMIPPADVDVDSLITAAKEEGMDIFGGLQDMDYYPPTTPLCLQACTEKNMVTIMAKRFEDIETWGPGGNVDMLDPLDPADYEQKWVTVSAKDNKTTYVHGKQAFRLYQRLLELDAHNLIAKAVLEDMPHTVFPQTTDSYSAMMCNQNEYGNASLVYVGGVIDLG